MKSLKKIAIRLLILCMLLVCSNYVYVFLFYDADLREHSDIIYKLRPVMDSTEILYLGESSNITPRADDIDKSPISRFIAGYYPSVKMGHVTKEASHAEVYYTLLKNIPEDSRLETLIVTMNLRSFNAGWINSKLETAIQKYLVLLRKYPPLLNRLILSFKGYEIKSDEERESDMLERWENDILRFPFPFEYINVIDWDKGIATKGVINEKGQYDENATTLACHYVKNYAFQIDTFTNPRIKDFDNIVSLAKERGWNLVFNLLAENTENANAIVGQELIYLMDYNRKLLIDRYQKNGVIVVDNLDEVPDNEFVDRDWPTEHYAETGRKIIAKNVADSLNGFYKDQYKKVIYTNSSDKTSFINDCEGELIWGQMGSITEEKYYSGKKSSKANNEKPFSITFERKIGDLPEGELKKVNVGLWIWQEALNNDAKLVLEISGESFEWYGININEITESTESWTKIEHSFEITSIPDDEQIMKVYVLNQSLTIIYIDDLSIDLEIDRTNIKTSDISIKCRPDGSYFNNCDDDNNWLQWQTYSNEQAFSGSYSSKIDKDKPYSITFQKKCVDIQEQMDSILVELYVYKTEKESSAKLVIENSGSEQLWHGIELEKLTVSEFEKWQKVKYVYRPDKKIDKNGLLKIYVFNPDPSPVYVDDLLIKFY